VLSRSHLPRHELIYLASERIQSPSSNTNPSPPPPPPLTNNPIVEAMPPNRSHNRSRACRGVDAECSATRRRQLPENGGRRWTTRETDALASARSRGVPYKEIAKALGKSELGCRLHYMNHRKREINRSRAQAASNVSNEGQLQLQPAYNRYAHIAPAPAVPRSYERHALHHPNSPFRALVPARNQDARCVTAACGVSHCSVD